MAQRTSKNSKKKYGLTAAYTPRYHSAPTETAKVPLWQPDGVKFVTKEDFGWLIKNGHIDMAMPEEVITPMPTEMLSTEKAKDPQS